MRYDRKKIPEAPMLKKIAVVLLLAAAPTVTGDVLFVGAGQSNASRGAPSGISLAALTAKRFKEVTGLETQVLELAVGGSSVEEWLSTHVHTAVAAIQAVEYNVDCMFIVWHQGEANRFTTNYYRRSGGR